MNYKAISCTFHDYIEHFIVRNELVELRFLENNIEKTLNTRILDCFTSPTKEEFIKIENYDIQIRLEKIISINEYKLENFCD